MPVKTSGARRRPSARSGRGYVSRSTKKTTRRPSRTSMRSLRASGNVKRSGRGYIRSAGGKAPKRAAARPSMRSGRGTIKRSSAGSYKKSTARRRPSARSGIQNQYFLANLLF